MRPLLLADLPAQSHRDAAGRVLLTPWDLDHVEYVRHAFDQTRAYSAGHLQIVLALVRSIRMLRAAVAERDDRAEVVAELDRQVSAALAAAQRCGLDEAEVARLRAAAAR